MFQPLPIALLIILIYFISSIKILAEYERGVIFRLGRVLPSPKGPGLILVFRPVDRMVRISLRLETLEVPSQDVVTRDNVTVKVNAVVFFRVLDPKRAVIEVAKYLYTTSQLAQTSLRSVLGQVELDELLSEREKLNLRLQTMLDQDTEPWGIKVVKVEVKQVDFPDQMIRAIARQAEAERIGPARSRPRPQLTRSPAAKYRSASVCISCTSAAVSSCVSEKISSFIYDDLRRDGQRRVVAFSGRPRIAKELRV